MNTEFANIELDLITSSLTNPRTNFNQAKLTELVESIKAGGVHQPVLVRPLPGSRLGDTDRGVQFELVCGERRMRASQQAGCATIPAMVRALTDDQVMEIQIIENLQREDLTELEEAEGYEALMQHANITVDQVGAKIGKSRSYVYGRIKLLDLCSEARSSLRDSSIDFSRALLVARIPDHKLQIKAMKEIIAGNGYSNPREPLTYRQALDYVQRNYMLKLGEAKFKITSVDLVPAAGSCKNCTKRTGHDPDLFSDVKGADVCTDPPCFHKKEEAHSAAMVKEAQTKGQTVIAGNEALELRSGNGHSYRFIGYRRLDSAEDSPTDQPLRKLIGALMKSEGIKPVLIESNRNKGELVECLPNEVALKLLKLAEQQAVSSIQQSSTAPTASKEIQKLVDDKKAKAEAKAKAQFEQEWRNNLLEDSWSYLCDDAKLKTFNSEVHRYLTVRAACSLSSENAAAICKILDLGKVSPIGAVADYARETLDPEALHLLIVMQESSGANEHSYNGHIANEGLLLIAKKVFGDKLDDVIKEIKGEVKAKIWPKVALKKAPLPLASAAQQKNTAEKIQKTPTAVLAKKSKMSAEDAKLGIAAAMQGIEGSASANAVALPGDTAAGIDQAKYRTASQIVITQRNSNPAHLVTMLGVNLSIAKGMLAQMESEGIVGPVENDGARKVLATSPFTVADDPQFQTALDVVVREQKANVRLIKAKLKVGTTRALELMDKLEQAGKVSACDERGARKVLVAA